MQFKLPVTNEILSEVSKLDRFQGQWSAGQATSSDRLRRIEEASRIRSAASSCRLAGIRVTDAEAAGLIRGEGLGPADAIDVQGYAHCLERELAAGELLTGESLCRLHAQMVGAQPVEPSPWRAEPLHREAFDAEGRATGQPFPTLPPRLVQRTTEELATWLELELHSREQHPVLVVNTFVLGLLAISPFERANGRLSRLLTVLLLRRAGYSVLRYGSLEAQLEAQREEYQTSFSRSHTMLWTGEADLTPWLTFSLEALGHQRERLEATMALEQQVQDYPPLQRVIVEAVREHGSVDAALLLRATGANRNTLKDNLRRLVERGVLERIGHRRGTRYRMHSALAPGPAATVAEH